MNGPQTSTAMTPATPAPPRLSACRPRGGTTRRRGPQRAVIVVALICSVMAMAPGTAQAGTYPMYQCSASHPTIASGWTAFTYLSNAAASLASTCASGGSLEDYVSSHQQAGVVEEHESSGSQVGIALNVPASAPDVSIAALSEDVKASPVTGNDAWVQYFSASTKFGEPYLPDGGGGFAAHESWTLPQGARSFTVAVNCSTDHSSTSCYFREATHVPAISNVQLTLVDSTRPTVTHLSGSLVTAAAAAQTVGGSQTVSYEAADADSGVLTTTVSLVPQGPGSTYTRTLSFAAQCTYESWNACPTSPEVGSIAVPTAAVPDGRYAVQVSVADAAGNSTTDEAGTITTANKPAIATAPSISGDPVLGQRLTASPGQFSSDPAAGTASVAPQWQLCDPHGDNCASIPGATGTEYNPVSGDIGHTVRYSELVSNNDGATAARSEPLGPIQPEPATAPAGGEGSGGSTNHPPGPAHPEHRARAAPEGPRAPPAAPRSP